VSYDSAVAKLYALGHELARTPSQKFDLAHMRVLLEALGHPERRFRSVLIAGTNGKGSTAATLASILQAAGYRTALYTSPHLIRLNERLRVNGAEIGDDEFGALHERVEKAAGRLVESRKLPWHPSFFEMLTAIAFCRFAEAAVDIAVLEVGMGGRLDATNVVEPMISVITDIALDHQKFLGNTVTEIAREKAGIIQSGGVVVTLPQHPEANDVIGNAILERNARVVSAVPYVPPVSPGAVNWYAQARDGGTGMQQGSRESGDGANGLGENAYPLTVLGKVITVESPLAGRHQLRNVALAIAAAVELNQHGFAITADQIERGIRETHWPGRFQVVPATGNSPEFVLDVAHNPAGAWSLRSAISERYGERPLTFVFGAMRDKAIGEMAEILFPLAAHVVATRADNPRSASPEEIREAAARTGAEIVPADDVAAAITRARDLAGAGGLVVITGSIYIVGEAMQELGLRA
jgi:dihydrofolate synthase/folylpolyglutamate synthase